MTTMPAPKRRAEVRDELAEKRVELLHVQCHGCLASWSVRTAYTFAQGRVRAKYAILRTLPETMTPRLAGSKAALRAFGELIAAGADADAFANAGVRALTTYVGADLATLSDCDLISGHRRVLGARPTALGQTAIATFDRHFRAHPLVAFHAAHHDGGAHRISDSWPRATFERTPLYNEYYRPIGIRHAVAVPLYVDGRRLVSFVLNRAGRDFARPRDR